MDLLRRWVCPVLGISLIRNLAVISTNKTLSDVLENIFSQRKQVLR